MNILIFAPFAVTEFHFATDLEIAQRHLDEGDHVTIAVCNADLLTCEANAGHDIGRCARCIGDRIEGISRLSPKPEVIPFLRLSPRDQDELRNIDVDGMTLDDLRKLHFDNFDAGWAVRSSLISTIGTSEFEVADHKFQIRIALRSAVAVYRSMQHLLTDLKVDRVYVYNGRYATMRAVLRAAQSKGIDCYIHERGSTFEKYALFENHLLHEVDYCQDLIRRAWDDADPDVREAVGAAFYADRLTGSLPNWISYSVRQRGGQMPENWRNDANNVVIFTGSSDEVDAIDDPSLRGPYSDQYEGMMRIFAVQPPDPRHHYYVRMHPRSGDLPEPQARRLISHEWPHVTIIRADSPISTYTLMRRASRILSFGSTTGVEAVFWGIPSIIGERTFFDRLGSTYAPQTHEEMMHALTTELSPKDKTGALMYGYWQKTYGIPFRFFRPMGIFNGAFKGTPIRPHIAIRTAAWLLEHSRGRDARNRLHLEVMERRLIAGRVTSR